MIQNTKDVQAVIKEHKLTARCEMCGENHPSCLVFFDRQRKRPINAKYINKVRARNDGITEQQIRGLLNNYSTLCENCVRKNYPTRGNLPVHISMQLENIKRKRGCKTCGERNSKCLDFHHLDDKAFTIGGGSVLNKELILMEIEKCEVLCRNCHSKSHWEEMVE